VATAAYSTGKLHEKHIMPVAVTEQSTNMAKFQKSLGHRVQEIPFSKRRQFLKKACSLLGISLTCFKIHKS
jgi:hypothetical protein